MPDTERGDRSPLRTGVTILALATMIFLGWLGLFGNTTPHAKVEADRRPGAYADPRRVAARIQSDLERTAAGRRPWPLPPGVPSDPLEAVVDAYRLYLDGNTKAMDVQLKEIAAQARTRLEARTQAADLDPDTAARALAAMARLEAVGERPLAAARLVAGMRMVGGLLFLDAAHWRNADPVRRTADDAAGELWLRLPCRTVIDRVAELRQAQTTLGDLAGPLLSCPSDSADLAVLEAQAKAPAMLPARLSAPAQGAPSPFAGLFPPEPAAPPLPWDHETAVAWMDDDLDAAQAVLATDDSPSGKLDLALFLHAFRHDDAATVPTVDALLRAVDALALPRVTSAQADAAGRPQTYDGSEPSLLPSLRLAAAGLVPGYALPCPVLQARPALLAATRPSGAEPAGTVLPRSGCAAGRGEIHGFPQAEVDAFITAAEDADGHFLAHHRAPAALAEAQRTALQALKLAPRSLAEAEPPALDHPYQVWGLASLANRAVEGRVTAAYRTAAERLSTWYVRQGLDGEAAARATKTGLFRVVWGAACGDAPPTASLRGLLLDRAPVLDIRANLTAREPPELVRCAVHAGMDPLLLVAVGHPKALPLLLARGHDVDQRNRFGKTALMVAAQNDLMDSARELLDKGAVVNATTWAQDNPLLAHDGRTALMYAAGGGSLAMVKLLLEHGADPHLADTRGRRAVDYLLGLGPVPANTVMPAADRAVAAKLLF